MAVRWDHTWCRLRYLLLATDSHLTGSYPCDFTNYSICYYKIISIYCDKTQIFHFYVLCYIYVLEPFQFLLSFQTFFLSLAFIKTGVCSDVPLSVWHPAVLFCAIKLSIKFNQFIGHHLWSYGPLIS